MCTNKKLKSTYIEGFLDKEVVEPLKCSFVSCSEMRGNVLFRVALF